jgi:hypothetical protein
LKQLKRNVAMGREVKRVPIDFNWPLRKVWSGFINPLYRAKKCEACDGAGYSPEARHLIALWYGHDATFRPEQRGSTPFLRTEPAILAIAERNVRQSPDYYGTGERAVTREAIRLTNLFNSRWCHHLNAADVDALIAADRLQEFTHDWTKSEGWKPKVSATKPTPREVNIWSLSGFGHDSINQHICVKAECERIGTPHTCHQCDGNGDIWPSAEAKQSYDDWEETQPPVGDAYQIWETVSEGSPVSPPCESPEALAEWMEKNGSGVDEGTTFAQWLACIKGPGWAPSGMVVDGVYMNGVQGVS